MAAGRGRGGGGGNVSGMRISCGSIVGTCCTNRRRIPCRGHDKGQTWRRGYERGKIVLDTDNKSFVSTNRDKCFDVNLFKIFYSCCEKDFRPFLSNIVVKPWLKHP